jgi:hypothetical protein
VLTPPATGFPAAAAQPSAVGEPGYSPLVQVVFRDKTVVLDAPQVANATGQADKIVSIAPNHQTVSYRETDGCYDNESVHYASFDASNPVAAAIEDVRKFPNKKPVDYSPMWDVHLATWTGPAVAAGLNRRQTVRLAPAGSS